MHEDYWKTKQSTQEVRWQEILNVHIYIYIYIYIYILTVGCKNYTNHDIYVYSAMHISFRKYLLVKSACRSPYYLICSQHSGYIFHYGLSYLIQYLIGSCHFGLLPWGVVTFIICLLSNLLRAMGLMAYLIRTCIINVFTRAQFWPSGIVVACVCLCPFVHASITSLSARYLITRLS